ncbi:Homocysteine S-methyltransferase [Penicillium expansum]|nr:Homocysteine S-methyltransferase [Penicillium expansum]
MATIQILDGGLGTSLGDLYNIHFDSTTTPLWASHLLVSDPATLQACQRDFGVAGVDVLLTATYQVSAEGFARTKTPQFPDGIPRSAVGPFLQKAVDIAEQAKVRESASVALSLGPYGACMIPGQEYSGAYDAEHDSEESLYLWHLDRLRMFAEADGKLVSRVRYVAFETLPRLDEVHAVRRAIRDSAFDVPFWIACVFPRDDDFLPDGSSVEEVVRAALAPLEGGAVPWGIGANCTKMHKLGGLVDLFGRAVAEGIAKEEISAVPSLVLYPDGTNGEVYNTTTQIWEKNDALSDNVSDNSWEEQLAQVVNEAYEKGHFKSFLVGGCCKASHHDIKKLGQQFKIQ